MGGARVVDVFFFSSVCGQRLYCDWAVGLSQYQNFNFRMKLKGAVCTF